MTRIKLSKFRAAVDGSCYDICNSFSEVQTEILWTEDSLLSHCHQDGHKDPPSSSFIECDYHQSDPVVYGDQGWCLLMHI